MAEYIDKEQLIDWLERVCGCCADEAEIEKIKGEFEFSQKKKILTDIRDYLVTEKGRVANSDIYLLQIQAVENFADKALADLTKYAEKLGVEL